jgi:protein O-GlcNAc transferase
MITAKQAGEYLARADTALHAERPDQARQWYDKVLPLEEAAGLACLGIAVSYQKEGDIDQARPWYRRAAAHSPGMWQIWNGYGNLLAEVARIEEAIVFLARAQHLAPSEVRIACNRLMALYYSDKIGDQEIVAAARIFGRCLAPLQQDLAPPAPRHGGPLRVGFVSPDLAVHPVGLFLLPLIRELDRERVAAFAYFTGPYRDVVTDLIKEHVTWREAAALSDEQLAAQIHADGIDVLIDLSGYTRGNRLALFARRAAPVQISWLGYFGTTGLRSMDYVLTDRGHVPEGREGQFTEKLLLMPHCRFCFEPAPFAPEVAPPPMLRNGYVTFGSFNNRGKLTQSVIAAWAGVLHAVPGSRLLLKWRSYSAASIRADLLDSFASHGIAAERIEMRPHSSHGELFDQYADMDIALDPFPFSGGQTSVESLWMGVPILTMPGPRAVSRQTLSLLRTFGRPDWLREWVAGSPADLAAKAAALAADPEKLREIRSSLRTVMRASPLMDAKGFARDFEKCLLQAVADRGAEMPTITIDDKSYDLDALSDAAKQQLTHMQFADAEIQRLQMQLALAQTARNAYAAALKELLPK